MSDVLHFVGHGKESRMPIYLAARGLEHRLLLARRTGDDVSGFHDPDADAFIAPGVDVARVLDRHVSVRSVQAADVLVRQAVLRADEDFPQRPFMTHGLLSRSSRFPLRPPSWRHASPRAPSPRRAPTRPPPTHPPAPAAARDCMDRCP